jgi:hypothetical protein
VLHESSRPEELHRETAGQVVGHMATVDREVGHTVVAERRTDREEVGHTVLAGAGEAVVRKAKEAAQVHQTAKELVRMVHHRARERLRVVHRATGPVRAVHHRAKEPVQGVRMARATERCRAVAGKTVDWAEEVQKEELAERVLLLLRSRSRKHPSCRSGQRCPWACRPWAFPPWAYPPWAYRRR